MKNISIFNKVNTAKKLLIFFLFTMIFFTSNNIIYSNNCFTKAFEVIKKHYPEGYKILNYCGKPDYLSRLISCANENEFYQKLPNFLHEMVHYSGFKTMGFGRDRIRLNVSDQIVTILSGRTSDDLYNEGFYIPQKGAIVIRNMKLPPRKIILPYINKTYLVNPNFNLYLKGEEAENGYLSLLDELNAYTQELKLVISLYPRTIPQGKRTIQKDNIVAFQLMIIYYLHIVRKNYPQIYTIMKQNKDIVFLTKYFFQNAEAALLEADEHKYPRIRLQWKGLQDIVKMNKPEIDYFFK